MFKNRRSGQAVVEVALMMPWLAFLFVGVLDFGFYSYAAICTQNAARAAAMATSAGTTSQTNLIACTAALRELKGLPNMMGIAAPCPTDSSTVDDTHPVAAWITVLDCSSNPKCADCIPAACSATPPPVLPTSAQAWVTYQTLPMIPIPGMLMRQLTLTRVSEMRIIAQ